MARMVFLIPSVALALGAALFAGVSAQSIEKRIAPGITLHQKVSQTPPVAIHWIVVDPKAGARLEVEIGQDRVVNDDPSKGREIVSATAARHRAVAAINGDFFPFTGDPLGFTLRCGEIISEPALHRAAIGWSPNSRPIIGIPVWDAKVFGPSGEGYALAGINREAIADELVLLMPLFGAKYTSKTPTDAFTLGPLSRPPTLGATAIATVVSMAFDVTELAVPRSGAVLVGSGKASEFLRLNAANGARLKLKFAVSPIGWNQCTEAMGGGPAIVASGRSLAVAGAEGFGSSFATARHPRSAIGVTRDGRVILMAVDGRQAFSRGATLAELARYMLEAGAVDALNLDGGGSTAFVVRGNVVNSPSDGSERPVADSILVYATEKLPAPTAAHTLTPADTTLRIGDTARFSVTDTGRGSGVSAAANGVVGTASVVFGSAVGAGFLDQNGRFTALRAGVSSVTAWVNGVLLRAIVTVEAPTPN